MTAALINICVDPRLNHEAIRQQVRDRASGLAIDRIFITNDLAGNFGSSARNTIALLRKQRDPVVFAAILHHDDCLAGQAGMRHDLAATAGALQEELAKAGFAVEVLTGNILSESSTVVWSDRPPPDLEVLKFRMPRMYGR
jgi:hypothetical protein